MKLFLVQSRYHSNRYVLAETLTVALEAFTAAVKQEHQEFYEGEDPGGFDEWPVPESERDYTVEDPEGVEFVDDEIIGAINLWPEQDGTDSEEFSRARKALRKLAALEECRTPDILVSMLKDRCREWSTLR